ncbi:FmdB family transcriptional regulator [Subtercola sp. Z020]|nr:FmdB family zinc ribbon protein [Subtercola sp. Z020]PPF88429.1 FmdB family transcriptional regulator [Subtercola sp. Z020]
MPTYSYRCTECENAFDIQQAFTDDSLTVCPVCGGKLRKVFGSVGVTFNGSGFYRNDSRATTSSTEKPSQSSSDKASSGSKSSGSGSSESKSSGSSSSGSSSSGSDSKPTSAPAKPASTSGAA